jgi:predicted Zn-dependent protease with MMP-like domain
MSSLGPGHGSPSAAAERRAAHVGTGTVHPVRDDRHARRRRADTDRRRRPVDGFRAPDLRRFERLVEDAVAALPEGLLAHLDNVQITVTDVPPPDPVGTGSDEVLLGLYQGVPKTRRGWGDTALPDRISLFRRPLEARANSKAELADLIRETVVHEIAHHFGIDDDRLDELGWG